MSVISRTCHPRRAFRQLAQYIITDDDMATVTVPGPVHGDHGHHSEKLRDSAIDIDIDICGVLEHTTVDEGWELDSSNDGSSLLDEEKETSIGDELLTESLLPPTPLLEKRNTYDKGSNLVKTNSYLSLDSLTSSLPSSVDGNADRVPASRQPFSASPDLLLEAAIHRSNPGYEVYYNTPAYGYVASVQPAFPTVFHLFDYGDGSTYYLGGGGSRIAQHLSQRGRSTGHASFWPFANPPLYACGLHHPSTGRPPIVLYGGLNADCDGAWADVQFSGFAVKTLGSFGDITIGLPPMTSRRTAWEPLSEDESPAGRTEETLHVQFGWHKRYRFEVEVEADGPASFLTNDPPRREAFEWRYCSGAELKALEEDGSVDRRDEVTEAVPKAILPRRFVSTRDKAHKTSQLVKRTLSLRRTKSEAKPVTGEKKTQPLSPRRTRWQSGWQLVRLAEAADPFTDAIQAAKSTTMTASPSIHSSTASTLFLDQLIADEAGRAAARRRTADGKEIVAMWANATTKRADDDGDGFVSTCMASRFTFLGSGASGQLGERWALMAVVSGLAVWERARRSRRRRQSTVVSACGGLANIGA